MVFTKPGGSALGLRGVQAAGSSPRTGALRAPHRAASERSPVRNTCSRGAGLRGSSEWGWCSSFSRSGGEGPKKTGRGLLSGPRALTCSRSEKGSGLLRPVLRVWPFFTRCHGILQNTVSVARTCLAPCFVSFRDWSNPTQLSTKPLP